MFWTLRIVTKIVWKTRNKISWRIFWLITSTWLTGYWPPECYFVSGEYLDKEHCTKEPESIVNWKRTFISTKTSRCPSLLNSGKMSLVARSVIVALMWYASPRALFVVIQYVVFVYRRYIWGHRRHARWTKSTRSPSWLSCLPTLPCSNCSSWTGDTQLRSSTVQLCQANYLVVQKSERITSWRLGFLKRWLKESLLLRVNLTCLNLVRAWRRKLTTCAVQYWWRHTIVINNV